VQWKLSTYDLVIDRWRINVFWTTATCSTEPLVEGTDGVSAEEQPKRKPHFRRNVSLQRLREIMLDPGQTQACGNAPWAPPGSKLADQLEAGVFNLTRYVISKCCFALDQLRGITSVTRCSEFHAARYLKGDC
jgi:hypothetical protein